MCLFFCHFVGKKDIIGQNLGKVVKILSQRVSKSISVRTIYRNVVKNVLNGGQFAQDRSFLVKMVKIGSFCGPIAFT